MPRSRSSPWSAGLGQQVCRAATSSTASAPSDDIRVYQPSTRPGAPLPHAWIDDEDGRRRPVKDLVAPGRFLLIAGEDGQAWCEAARQLAAEADIPLDAVRIGHLDGDCHDPRCAWLRHQQIVSDGAVLVRPDRFIAWRYPAAASDPRPSSPPCSARSFGADRLLRGADSFLTGAGAAQR